MLQFVPEDTVRVDEMEPVGSKYAYLSGTEACVLALVYCGQRLAVGTREEDTSQAEAHLGITNISSGCTARLRLCACQTVSPRQ